MFAVAELRIEVTAEDAGVFRWGRRAHLKAGLGGFQGPEVGFRALSRRGWSGCLM